MEENRVVDQGQQQVEQQKDSSGKIIGLIGIVIAIIALVIALSNMGVKNEVAELKKTASQIAQKEQLLELKAVELQLLAGLDRIYALTMVERNYEAAGVELAKVEKAFAQLKGSMDPAKAAAIEKSLSYLKAEIEKGPSPIPSIIASIRSNLAVVKLVPAKAAPEKTEEKPVEKKEVAKKAEIKKLPATAKPVEEGEASGLKKTYMFWKKLGESLVKKK